MRPGDPRYSAIPLDGSPSVNAKLDWVIVCWPVIDPYQRHFIAQKAGNDALVGRSMGFFLSEEAMHEANPVEMLERGEKLELPPTLTIHGTADTNVPIELAQRFTDSYNAAGGQAKLEKFEGMPHGFGNEPGPETDRLVQLVKEFIAKQL